MIGFDAAKAIRDQVTKVLKQDLPALVKKQVQQELHQGSMSIPTPSADAVLQNGIYLNMKARIQTTDAFGRVILNPAPVVYGSNDSILDKMKNKINYGVNPDNIGLNNKGRFKRF